MQFRTQLKMAPQVLDFNHKNKILTIGSCFTENVGGRLQANEFQLYVNPFGILFNPISIEKNLRNAIKQEIDERLLVERDQFFYHYDYPSKFFAPAKNLLLDRIAAQQFKFKTDWSSIDRLIITFGTSWVYRHLESNEIVANCHKIPQVQFRKELLDLNLLKPLYLNLLTEMKVQNPSLQILLTVSPVRHTKDGLHENNLSKSILLLLSDYLVKNLDFVRYFPAYELIIDDLRDYRFYREDMIHPTEQAISYVYDRFKEVYFSDKTKEIVKLTDELMKLHSHRALNVAQDNSVLRNRETALREKIDQLKIEA